jgi:hypothetical protein
MRALGGCLESCLWCSLLPPSKAGVLGTRGIVSVRPRRWLRARLWVTATSLALAISACGTSPQFPSTGSGGESTHVAASWPNWDQCMRSHGVDVPAGFIPDGHHGPKPQASAAVYNACQRYEPLAPLPPESVQRQVIAASKCMAAHGFQNSYKFFPGGDAIMYAPGIRDSTPGFATARQACGRFA